MKYVLGWFKIPSVQVVLIGSALATFVLAPRGPSSSPPPHHPSECHACRFSASPDRRAAFDAALLRAGYIEEAY